ARKAPDLSNLPRDAINLPACYYLDQISTSSILVSTASALYPDAILNKRHTESICMPNNA
ncbi:MAG: hypothetical protein AAF267_03575, partial [Deinococcota bacterium]